MNTPITILDNTFNCIFQIDSNLNIVYWNNAMEIVSGILKKDAIGQYIFDLIPSLSEECDYYFKEAVLKEGRIIELHLQRFTAPVSQNKITVRARYFPQVVGGKVIGLYGIWKQLNYDYEERDYLNLLKSVILNTNDSIMVTKAFPVHAPEGPVIIYSNPAFSRITGYKTQEILGKTPRMVQGEDTNKEARNNIRESLESWTPVQQEVLNYTKTGEEFWVDLSIVPVKNEEGYFTHWISVQRDITEKIQDQEKLKALNNDLENLVKERTKELEKFIYFASHDLREPVRTIHSFLDLLKKRIEGNLDETSIEYLEFVQDGAKSIQRMIEGLLSYSQVQKASLKLQKINFGDVIHGAKNNLTLMIKEADATIEVGKMPDVTVDFSLMINVMQNLISNAIKHCDLAKALIHISSEETEDLYLIKIKDNGRGIEDERIASMFNMFDTIKRDRTKQSVGAGLVICKNIIEKHNGKISVASQIGKGSTFIIQLNKG